MTTNRQFNIICAAAVTSALAAGLISAPTLAQEAAQDTTVSSAPADAAKNSGQIQTVIITANKRKEDASKVPLSISVVGGDELTAQHIVDFETISRAIPNVSFSGGGGGGNAGNGPGLSNIEMRGVSASGGMSTTGVYMDDVSMSAGNVYSMGAAEPKFFDLDHVEVLRGPQGTLYGASSMGGTVKFISNQPNLKENEVNISADVSQTAGGNGINHTETGVFNRALIPGELALRIGVQSAHLSGYIDQTTPDGSSVIAKGINWENDAIARIALKWAPTKNLTITPQLFYQQIETGDINVSYLNVPALTLDAYNAGQTGPALPKNQTPKLEREPGKDTIFVPSLTLNYSMDVGDVTSVTSYFKREFDRTQDGTAENPQYIAYSGSISDPALAAAVYQLPSQIVLKNEVTQFSQEVRLASKAYDPSVSPFTWVGGFYTSTMNTNINENDPIPGISKVLGVDAFPGGALSGAIPAGFPNDNSYFAHRYYTDVQNSVFGEVNYYVAPTVHFTTGLRYLRATDSFARVADYYFNGGPGVNPESTSSSSKATPKFAATWEVNPTNTLYASAAEGFRVGGANFKLPSQCGVDNPAGYAPDSLWSYEVGNKSRFLNNTLSINADLFYLSWKNLQQLQSFSCGFNYVTNVGSATSTGAEIEVKYKPTPHIVIDLSGGVDHAVLADNTAASIVTGAVQGANVPGVPKFNAALTGTYSFAVNDNAQGFVRGGAQWVGPSYGALDPTSTDYQRPAYANVDLSTGISFEQYDFSFYVKNVADNQKVIQHPVVQTALGEVYRLAPRTVGFTFNGRF